MSGVKSIRPARKRELNSILNGFGVIIKGNELTTMATPSTFPMRKHNYLQALMAVDDFYIVASPKVESFFLEDVSNWIVASMLNCLPRYDSTKCITKNPIMYNE